MYICIYIYINTHLTIRSIDNSNNFNIEWQGMTIGTSSTMSCRRRWLCTGCGNGSWCINDRMRDDHATTTLSDREEIAASKMFFHKKALCTHHECYDCFGTLCLLSSYIKKQFYFQIITQTFYLILKTLIKNLKT
jgi:hypothetical protein